MQIIRIRLVDRKNGTRKPIINSWYGILFVSAMFYLTAGYFLSLAYVDWVLMIIGIVAFFCGVGYDSWALRYHLKKQKDLEDKVQQLEQNTKSIDEILQIIKDILKK